MASPSTMRSFAATQSQRIRISWMQSKGGEKAVGLDSTWLVDCNDLSLRLVFQPSQGASSRVGEQSRDGGAGDQCGGSD